MTPDYKKCSREKHDAGMEEVFLVRRKVAGMVLDAMGFVENGL